MKKMLFAIPLLLMLLGCAGSSNGETSSSSEEDSMIQYGTVLFFNVSSYSVSVHADAFSGPVIVELASGESKSVSVKPSGNHGVGSTFAIGFKTKIIDGHELSCGEIYAYGVDPDMQFNINVEAEKRYTLQIPQPSNLVYETAFLKILNASSNSFELTRNSVSYKQAGNGVLPVGAGEIGVYEIPSSTTGTAFENYKVKSVFTDYDIPSFDAMHSHIYTFSFDGSSVIKKSEEEIGNY